MTEHQILNALLAAIQPFFDEGRRRFPEAGRALAILTTAPFRVSVVLEAADGRAIQALEQDGDIALGNAIAPLLEHAIQNSDCGSELTRMANDISGATFRLFVDEAGARVSVRFEIPGVGFVKVGELRAVETTH